MSLHLGEKTHFEDVVLHQVQLKVSLVGALELNDWDGLESLLDRRHYSQRVRRHENNVVLLSILSQQIKVLDMDVVLFNV